SKTFHLDQRILMTGRKNGLPIDTANVQRATRSVSESVDDLFFNGGFTYGAATVYGYLTHPQRNTIAGGETSDWNLPAITGTKIVDNVISMVDAAFQDNISGPFVLYIPFDYNAKLDADFKADSDMTIRERILKINGVQAIVPTRRLADLNVVLVTMRSDVVDTVVGFRPTPVQWETQAGAVTHFKVMSIIVPRIKQDSDNRSGIVHLTLTA
ncbi:MAG: major capsid protein, partial [Geminicoccaceae bacterium]